METVKEDIRNLYSITEYAKMMNVTRQTVHNWIKDQTKDIKVVNISGRPFIKLKTA